MTIIGPGDDDRVRLVLATRFSRDSLMKIETGDAGEVFYLDVISRSLASFDEREAVALGFTRIQLMQLITEAVQMLGLDDS